MNHDKNSAKKTKVNNGSNGTYRVIDAANSTAIHQRCGLSY